MNNFNEELNNIGTSLSTVKSLAVLVEKLYMYFYDSDFEECDKKLILCMLIKEIKQTHKNYQILLQKYRI